MSKDNRVSAIILAGGTGSRMKSDITKQRMTILGKTVLYHALRAFELCGDVFEIVVVANENEVDFATEQAREFKKVSAIVKGGKTRAESARAGFLAISDAAEYVAIHDAARPLITPKDISAVIKCAYTSGAASMASAVNSTLKIVDESGVILDTLDRSRTLFAETPQVFRADIYCRALENSPVDASITDDNMMVEHIGEKITMVCGSSENLKITTMRDIKLAELIMAERMIEDA